MTLGPAHAEPTVSNNIVVYNHTAKVIEVMKKIVLVLFVSFVSFSKKYMYK